MTDQKVARLQDYLRNLKSGLVALSGGVDSAVLTLLASQTQEFHVNAITVTSPAHPSSETDSARVLCEKFDVPHAYIKIDQLENNQIRSNTALRCYHCKFFLYETLLKKAKNRGLEHVLDGSNLDDLKSDDRPGMKAVKELSIKTPLIEAGLTKADIRNIARQWKLPMWDLPASACLFTRIPTGEPLDMKRITRIGKAEEFMKSLGFRQVRVRDHNEIARIEVVFSQMNRIIKLEYRQKITTFFQNIGYRFICIDLKGYTTGSMNIEITKPARMFDCGADVSHISN